ncbi:MAG: ribonuclease R [Ghiorsea sp.]
MSEKKVHRGKPKDSRRQTSKRFSQEEEKPSSPWDKALAKKGGSKAEPRAESKGDRKGPAKDGKPTQDKSPWVSTPAERKRKFKGDSRESSEHQGHGLGGGDKVWTGTVSAHPDGFGFVNVEGRDEDVFLSIDEMRDVMHGDTVDVRTISRRGREAGILVRIVKHAPSEITAQFKIDDGMGFAYPRSKRMQQAILVKRDDAMGAHHEDWVRIKIERGTSPLRGKIIEVLGDDLTPKKLVDMIVAEQALSETFPPEVLKESDAIPERIRVRDKKDRLDLTHLPFVTIDGADARDFDDAICVTPRGEGYEAWVAIADVAHYVHEGSALDVEAQTRGNSFYFPDRVIPMLPEKLSNGLCSLNPHVPRLAMAVRMRFDAGGKRRSARMYDALIHSHARLTYEQAAEWLEDKNESAIKEPEVRDMLDSALGLYKMLEKGRAKRGALELELPEVRAVLKDDVVTTIEGRDRNVAHKLIEEMMLAANTAVSMFMESKKAKQLFRIHPAPEREAIEKLNAFLGAFGLKIRHPAGEDVRPKDVQQALHAAEDKPFVQVLHRLVLRSMQQAKYTTENAGHFGLAYECYGHFTSPIRRYADLTTHRRLKSLINETKTSRQDLEAVGAHVSTQERIQQRAEWDTQAMLAALYHKKDVGSTLGATISGVSKRRIFLSLQDTYAEAALNVDDLGQMLNLDEVHHRLASKNGTFSLGLGDQVQVEILSTDPVRGLINVSLVPGSKVDVDLNENSGEIIA